MNDRHPLGRINGAYPPEAATARLLACHRTTIDDPERAWARLAGAPAPWTARRTWATRIGEAIAGALAVLAIADDPRVGGWPDDGDDAGRRVQPDPPAGRATSGADASDDELDEEAA